MEQSLGGLNLHLDHQHSEQPTSNSSSSKFKQQQEYIREYYHQQFTDEEEEEDVLLQWLKKTHEQVSAPFKKLGTKLNASSASPSLDLIKSGFTGVFELNEDLDAISPSPVASLPISSQQSTACAFETCQSQLGIIHGKHLCPKCLKWYCESHSRFQMKLRHVSSSQTYIHDTNNGFWTRVCQTCYSSRDGYNDRHGN